MCGYVDVGCECQWLFVGELCWGLCDVFVQVFCDYFGLCCCGSYQYYYEFFVVVVEQVVVVVGELVEQGGDVLQGVVVVVMVMCVVDCFEMVQIQQQY